MFVFGRYLSKPDIPLAVETTCRLNDENNFFLPFLQTKKSKTQ